MMYGMFGLGWLMMLLVIGIPVLLIVLVVGGANGHFHMWGHPMHMMADHDHGQQSMMSNSQPAVKADKYCSHCGAGLQAGWTHCPQCGAPIE